jgi:hypothetical protein
MGKLYANNMVEGFEESEIELGQKQHYLFVTKVAARHF